ncbi:MAG: PQQ-binding-like beta-propeller repeat protein [Planctomycetota bacterium]|nr:PQQ-binding-like beta-propeller repeat protein [Planctomycetota bacterium]MDP7249048.1 PQQ-binding-like beta-propeller repeat protein [Planctomycetota bacterium]
MIVYLTLLAIQSRTLDAGDWPMWRKDELRSAVTDEVLPETLTLLWRRDLPALTPAYRNARLHFDRGYEPVVLEKRLFVASSHNDSLTAMDTETGKVLWRLYAGGPIRFAPVVGDGKVWFGSDDGVVYCVNASDGKVLWTLRAVPSKRMLLGNGRLISVWPIRGGPVLRDGRLYFAAGVWSFEGVFVYCVEAESGKVIWRNDRAGYIYGKHPHNAEAFGGLTPQGYLVINGDDLIVPCGSALPATFDLKSGRLNDFSLPAPGRDPGGWFASVLRSEDGQNLRRGTLTLDSEVNQDRHEDRQIKNTGTPGARNSVRIQDKTIRFADGFRNVKGTIHSMLAADGKAFVVTLDGSIHCFGDSTAEPAIYERKKYEISKPESLPDGLKQALDHSGRNGFTAIVGNPSSPFLESFAGHTELHVLAFHTDETQCGKIRGQLDDLDLYGTRISVLHGDGSNLPPYIARLIYWTDGSPDQEACKTLFRSVRPYGGRLCFTAKNRPGINLGDLPGAELRHAAGFVSIVRAGALPGATDYLGDWAKSRDALVKAPLGVLWFDDTVGLFKRSPQPRILNGVMASHKKRWIEDFDKRAGGKDYRLTPAIYTDVYTGTVLGESDTEDVRKVLPKPDLEEVQPSQYRPPSQIDHWAPDAPQPGTRVNPLNGKEEPRRFPKSYGCDGGFDYGNLFTMRSGTAAFYDKTQESGTINISGPRSGCTNSVIPANGVLNIPYFYEGCTCSYPLPTALALVSMPQTFEQWASWGKSEPTEIKRIGINFGAPGDRLARGTLWLDVPGAGGPSPAIDVKTEPANVEYFYRHSLWVKGGNGWPWVAASGVRGLSKVSIGGLKKSNYIVRLTFCAVEPGHRDSVFDVALQGRQVCKALNVFAEADSVMRSLVREFKGISSSGRMEIELTPVKGRTLLSGIELIARE